MKKYLLCNIAVKDIKSNERNFTINILKDVAYYGVRRSSNNNQINYYHVMIPIADGELNNPEVLESMAFTDSKVDKDTVRSNQLAFRATYALTEFMLSKMSILGYVDSRGQRQAMNYENFCNTTMFRVEVIQELDTKDIGIFYTDGSSYKTRGDAGYGMSKLLEETVEADDTALYDSFSETYRKHSDYCGHIENGTNNMGELTGLKAALMNIDADKMWNVIISDSDYALKTFRDWYPAWTSKKRKTAQNAELIQEIAEIIDNLLKNNHIILFKWTKGHTDTQFNELCDKLANKGKTSVPNK